MSFPRYPEYKDSGVEWLGEVPTHWKARPIKALALLKGGAGFPDAEQGLENEELYFYKVGSLGQANAKGILQAAPDSISRDTAIRLGAFVFPAGTLTFAKVGAALLLARIRQLPAPSCLDNNMMGMLVSEANDARFVLFAMSLVRFDLIANPGAVPSLNASQIEDFQLAVPPLREQTAIATFLDRETAKIDALVAEQEKLIALLQEKRQAVISHAVTKGLDPNVPMKDSGVEWLGEVPAHWEVKRLRHAAELNPSKSEIAHLDRTTEVSFLPMEAIGDNGTISLERTRPVGDVETGYTYFQEGDVTIAKITPCFENGKGAVMRGLHNGCGFGTTELVVVRPITCVALSDFFHFLFISNQFRQLGEAAMYGAGGQKRVPDDFVRDFSVAFPSLAEQAEINAFLDRETAKFDILTAEARTAITLLQERRTALISAAVTGQIDVRCLAARGDAAQALAILDRLDRQDQDAAAH